ncbi:MAG: EamA/RhaT family transporter [Spirochaetaceae bacterium]|nr:MAG: EamA/RhaT family transporter [Spirochaetaceae bacterium]
MQDDHQDAQIRETYGYLFIAAAAVLWAAAGPVSRQLYNLGISPMETAFWRTAGAAVLFVIRLLVSRRNTGPPVTRRHTPMLIGFGALGVGGFMVSLAYAIDTGGINLAVILLYTSPAFVAVGAWLAFGEPINPERWILIALTIAGVVLVAVGGGRGINVTAVSLSWGFAATVTYSGYYLVGKWAIHRYRPPWILAVMFPVAAVSILPFVRFAAYTAPVVIWLLILSVMSTYLPYLLYYHGLTRVAVSRAVVVATIEPVVAALLAAIIFDEMYAPLALLGASFVIFAAARASMPVRGSVRIPKPSLRLIRKKIRA